MTTDNNNRPILILGAGVNGCALARELLLNGESVWIVEKNDISYGATSKSSRLIHGGLRYLEYGDVKLVAESLAERSHLYQLAPQFVTPLKLYIPVRKRFSGLFRAASRFLGLSRLAWFNRMTTKLGASSERGLWIVRMGIWMYDRFAHSNAFPAHQVVKVGTPNTPPLDQNKYRWLCAYYDAQMFFPERFSLALLHDARQIAAASGLEFRVFTYCDAQLQRDTVTLTDRQSEREAISLQPKLLVNATGAWGDLTLKELNLPSPQLLGGTKGSHLISYAPRLRERIGNAGVYAEADDGRLVFILPFVNRAVLVGTTDERFDLQPQQAIASEEELTYLLGMVNELFPKLQLTRDEIETHYSGVRPLPCVKSSKTGAIPRGHWIEEKTDYAFPILTLVGGKLTTARAFAEDVVQVIGKQLNKPLTHQSRDRVVPGGNDFPADDNEIKATHNRLAKSWNLEPEQISAIWNLCGNQVEEILRLQKERGHWQIENINGTDLPKLFVDWVIEQEWVTSLDDLIERRLMLVYQPNLKRSTLSELAQALVAVGRLQPENVDGAVETTIERLKTYYGKNVSGPSTN